MKTIRINCQGCMKSFDFQHSSVDVAGDLRNVTIDCKHCGAVIKAPNDEITMITIQQFIVRSARASGVEVPDDLPVEYIEIDQGDIADVISINRKLNATPAMMPPHPPVRRPRLTQRIGDAVTPRPIKDTPQA